LFFVKQYFAYPYYLYLYANIPENFTMENYIYILIGIVWVAYSLYSARQKALKKQQSAGLPQGRPSQSSPLPIPGSERKSLLEDIFREFAGVPAPVPQPSQPANHDYQIPESKSNESNEAFKISKLSPVTSFSPTNFINNEPENARKVHPVYRQLTKNDHIAKNFNLREAVIFSELLNRKYF